MTAYRLKHDTVNTAVAAHPEHRQYVFSRNSDRAFLNAASTDRAFVLSYNCFLKHAAHSLLQPVPPALALRCCCPPEAPAGLSCSPFHPKHRQSDSQRSATACGVSGCSKSNSMHSKHLSLQRQTHDAYGSTKNKLTMLCHARQDRREVASRHGNGEGQQRGATERSNREGQRRGATRSA